MLKFGLGTLGRSGSFIQEGLWFVMAETNLSFMAYLVSFIFIYLVFLFSLLAEI